MSFVSACDTFCFVEQECSQLLATRMVEHGGSASSLLVRFLDAATSQAGLIPSLQQLMQVSFCFVFFVSGAAHGPHSDNSMFRVCSTMPFAPVVSIASNWRSWRTVL
jgi:hypothetical protein